MSVASAKRSLLVFTCSTLLTLAACTEKKDESAAADAATAAKPSTALEGQLDIVAWPGYIERGQEDPNYDWVTQFEAQTGCKVNVKTAATSDEMVALMSSGATPPGPPADASWPAAGNAPFDLVTASGDASLRLIRGGWVQPIGLDRIKSYPKIDARLQQAPWHFIDGKHWGVPYQWGPNVLLYSTKVFKDAPTSWSVVFEEQKFPDGKTNKGRVQAYDGPIYIADAALYLSVKKPELGIKDPYELNEAAYAEVLNLLRGQRQLVHSYWHDAMAQVQAYQNEGIAASGSWPFQANTLTANKAASASTVPAEGATGWADTTMMAAGARHPNCAYAWMEWSISPKLQGDLAAWFGSNPVVPEACNDNALLGPEGCKKNGFENFDKIRFWRTPESKCAAHADGCVPYSRWVTDYVAIIGSK
jgi:putative spermidine/putrescine transport system substrate-binding protein